MLVCSLATGSILAATLTSALTLSHTGRKTDIDQLEDLKGQTVAVIGGMDVDDYLQNLDFSVVEKKSLAEALLALDNEDVVAVIADRLTVKSYLKDKNMRDVRVSDMVIRSNILSFALQKGSPLRDPVNKSIVDLENSNWIYRMCLHYLDRRDAAFCTL
jgi:polar amino acid transport system substrate-binding protein